MCRLNDCHAYPDDIDYPDDYDLAEDMHDPDDDTPIPMRGPIRDPHDTAFLDMAEELQKELDEENDWGYGGW